jgi:flagellar hook assembly protein FlgD
MGNVGLNVITWDGKDNAGNEVSSGIYFYKLAAGQYHAVKKMVMLK